MSRIQLLVYVDPSEIEIICKLKFKDGTFERLAAIVDTGAAVSLFPISLLAESDHRLTERRSITIDQAGIAQQSFEAIEAYITIMLEDASSNSTLPFEIMAWFADTNQPLIGFDDVLDRAVLHVDMLQRIGWLDID
jgi:hypothetical protein